MPDWNYPQTNASAGPSKSNGNSATDRRRHPANITYTHWSQQHLEANPDAGFELLQGLMQMSGSHDPLPPLPRSAFRNNAVDARGTDSTYSVLSNSTRNTDYTLGTPYSTISSSSSSAYPVANVVPDIPITSWMLQSEAKDPPSTNVTTSFRNGFSLSSSYQAPPRPSHRTSTESVNPANSRPSQATFKHTSSYNSANTTNAFASPPDENGFRVPINQNVSSAAHISRDGHLPANCNPQARFGFEDGEIIDEAQFSDRRVAPKQPAVTRSNDVWDYPSRLSRFQNNHQLRVPFANNSRAETQFSGVFYTSQIEGKGKERETIAPYSVTATTTEGWAAQSTDSDIDDDEAEQEDGYMRNCEPMVKSEKRTYKSMNLLGTPPPRLSPTAPSQSEHETASQSTMRMRGRDPAEGSPPYEPESSVEQSTRRRPQPLVATELESEGVTDEPCKVGARQRMAYIELPQLFNKNPNQRETYIYMDLPPIPTKSLRKAAIAARELTSGAAVTAYESLDEDEQPDDSEAEDEEEVVIEGDKFLTIDNQKDSQKDTCHQCQETSKEAKMSCCNTEVECSLRYCESCVEERYNFRFEAESRLFICPVCQGYCNCAPCLDKSKLIDKLHLAEIMDGSREEFHRILNRYKTVQSFLEAMGASKAPPVPRTIIHGIRFVRKAEDKQSRPIPQDVYHELMKPGKMEVTYKSMISLAGPIAWAFPKKPLTNKRKAPRAVAPEGDFEGAAEESDSDFDEVRERKRAKLNKKKSRQTILAPANQPPVIPFEFALDTNGQILFGNDGCPVINPIASPPSQQTPSKRTAKKQVTFSSDLDQSFGQSLRVETIFAQKQPQQLSPDAMRQAVQYIQRQLEQQQQQRDDPEGHADFRLDPTLQEFFDQNAEAEQYAMQYIDDSSFPSSGPGPEFVSDGQQMGAKMPAEEDAAASAKDGLPPSDEPQNPGDSHSQTIEEVIRNSSSDLFSDSFNLDNNTFDNVLAKVQHFQNDSPDNELDAIFGVFPYNGAADDMQDDRNQDFAMEGSSILIDSEG